MDEYKIIDQLNNAKGYDIALITTFNFDVRYFDRAVVRALNNCGVKKISVFVDREELNKAVAETPDSDIGKKYVVSPVEIRGAFHPKLILLLGKSRTKLLVMSANLTVSGYCTNHEIFNDFTYNEGSLENIGLIKGTIDFFFKLHELTHRQDETVFAEIKKLPYYRASADHSDAVLLHNLSVPIFSQLTELVSGAEQIDIAVPFYDNELAALSCIKEQYPNAKVNLYLQNQKSRIDDKKAKQTGASLFVFDKIHDKNGFYHGKVFRFHSGGKEYILYGSANCTASAVLKTYASGGNIECDVLEVGEPGEFNGFFEAFSLCPEVEYHFDLLKKSPEVECRFYFRYGKTEKDNVLLNIGYRELPADLVAEWNGMEVSYIIDNKAIVISLPYDQVMDAGSQLSIKLSYADRVETIACWYNDDILLITNRQSERKGELYHFNPYSTGSKFYRDMTAILRWSSMTIEELQDEEAVNALMNPDTKEADPENDDSDDDDGIVSYTIPTADISDRYDNYNQVRSCCAILINNYFGRHNTVSGTVSPDPDSDHHEPVPISEERRFVRFVKSRISCILKPEFVARDDFMRYWNGIHIFFTIFDKYRADQNTNNLFSPSYIAETKARLLSALLQKPYTNEYIEDIKTMVFRTIVEGYLLTDISAAENQLTKALYQELVRELDRRYDMREPYKENVQRAFFSALQRSNVSEYGSILNEIDSLFGYLPVKRILRKIMDIHGPKCTIAETDNAIIINADTSEITSFMNLNRILKYLNPLADYARVKGEPAFVTITVINNRIYPGKHDYTKRIIYQIDLKRRTYHRTLTRATGKSDAPVKGRF